MKVGLIGASGYGGGELLRILVGHPECEISCVTSIPTEAGQNISDFHPHLRDMKIKIEDTDIDNISSRSEVVFTATPHGVSMSLVPQLLERGLKVIDFSGDFRFSDVKVYEKYYGIKHEHPDIKAVYGLPELHRKEIKGAKVIANPGCYSTGAILGLVPIVKEDIVEQDRIVVDSKSGVSGAGAGLTKAVHFCMADESITPYKVVNHQHLPEIEKELRAFNPGVKISFTPHLAPVIRGISTTIHCFLKRKAAPDDIRDIYMRFYKGEPFVRALEAGEIPRMSSVRGTNYIEIGGFQVDEERKRVVISSAIDNLGKGAAGQAVQNMNIMAGFDETAGLKLVGLHP
ncbi:MAG: N-acetyl-gamma-glutamyl-phosphate reductase [Candidatus Hydrothermarchaeaceae archaeon]